MGGVCYVRQNIFLNHESFFAGGVGGMTDTVATAGLADTSGSLRSRSSEDLPAQVPGETVTDTWSVAACAEGSVVGVTTDTVATASGLAMTSGSL